ncbi:MAG: phosphatidate cytidylyltransferase [Pseudomonadota bacterium]
MKRWLTAIIALPVLIYLIGPAPRWLFHGFLFIASLVSLSELFAMAAPKLPWPVKISSFLLSFLLFYSISQGPFFISLAVLSFWVIVPLGLYIFLSSSRRANAVEEAGKVALGLLYISLPLSLLVFVDKRPSGNIWIFFLLAVIFLSDTGAFYAGRTLGRHKLHPSVSPGKTWEGAVGGLVGSLVAAFIFSRFFSIARFDLPIMILAASLSVIGQIGDLAESMLKRHYGLKDSGKVLPGHGGLLDRIDGLLFAAPVLYLFVSWSI